jgi:hypothetical protein
VVCAGDETSLECSTAGNALTETCNGSDDDCDGSIDEDYTAGGSVTYTDYDGSVLVKGDNCGTGVCSGGTVVCAANEISLECDTEGNAGAETCDGTDEDCDGIVDNGNPGGGASCDGTDSDLCEEGEVTCIGGTLTCADYTSSSLDICNGKDDDCDPASDDGDEDPQTGNQCSTGLPGVCSQGTNVCSAGIIQCEPDVGPSAETCNRLDDDCNGVADDGDICSGYLCEFSGCSATCTINADCYSGYTCSAGECI